MTSETSTCSGGQVACVPCILKSDTLFPLQRISTMAMTKIVNMHEFRPRLVQDTRSYESQGTATATGRSCLRT